MFSKSTVFAVISFALAASAQLPNFNPDLEKNGTSTSCSGTLTSGFTSVFVSCNTTALGDILGANPANFINELDSVLTGFCAPPCQNAFQSLLSNATANCNTDVPILASPITVGNNSTDAILSILNGATINNVTTTIRSVGEVGCPRSSDNSTFCVTGLLRNVSMTSAFKNANANSSASSVVQSVFTNQTIICTGCSMVEYNAFSKYQSQPIIKDNIFSDVNVSQALDTWKNTLSQCPAGSTTYNPPGGNSGNSNSAATLMASFSSLASAVIFAIVFMA